MSVDFYVAYIASTHAVAMAHVVHSSSIVPLPERATSTDSAAADITVCMKMVVVLLFKSSVWNHKLEECMGHASR
jgi:hypothetical protein